MRKDAVRILSLTGERQLRYPTPDAARGFMFALAALADVPSWLRYSPEAPHVGHTTPTAMGSADQWWYLARTLLVDHRAYSLFSILFGFGIAIMASRTMERERRAVMETFTAEKVAGWHPVQRQIIEESVERYARRTASHLIRRRGWQMLAFGLVHATFFSGDITGAHDLAAAVFARVIVMTHAWVRVLVDVLTGSLSLLGIWSMAAFMGREAMMLEFHDPVSLNTGCPLVFVASWLAAASTTVLMALMVPCVIIGVGIARWDLLQNLRGRGALLSGIAVCGLRIRALGELSFALIQLDRAFAGSVTWSYLLFHAPGVAGVYDWLALLTLAGGSPREKLGIACASLSAIGRRSMTAYLSQTSLFIPIYGLSISFGVCLLGVAVSGLITFVVWTLIGLGCIIAKTMGSPCGPARWALRQLIARSAKKRSTPVFVPVPVVRSDVSMGVTQASSFPVAPVPASGVKLNGDVQGGTYDSE